MKQLILVRHAKSSWKDPDMKDHDRPLNKRGKRDAPHMGKVLNEKKIRPDLMVSSSATRAIDTAKEFSKKLDYPRDKILQSAELYLAEVSDFLEYVQNISDDYLTVVIFGHNPGITAFADFLVKEVINDMPTGSVCAISLPVSSWKEVKAEEGTCEFFLYPKMYFKDSED